ncbi:MAG: copper chaperone PCu(A)C [Paracoccaceae bacterium]
MNDNGVMRMRQVEAIDVPAGGSAVLKPGEHLMLIDLTGRLVEGETVGERPWCSRPPAR